MTPSLAANSKSIAPGGVQADALLFSSWPSSQRKIELSPQMTHFRPVLVTCRFVHAILGLEYRKEAQSVI
jgi:hypothetical protein